MIVRLVRSSLRRRWEPFLLLGLATAAGVGALTATVSLRSRITEAAGTALAASGPNLVVRPRLGASAPFRRLEVDRIATLAGVRSAVPWASETSDGGPALLRTTAETLTLYAHWELDGRWPEAPGERVRGRRAEHPRAVGILTTGEPRIDEALLAALPAAADTPIDRIEIRADAARLDEIVATLRAELPGAEVDRLTRITETEAGLGSRLVLLLLGISVLILLLALTAATAATLTELESRRRELALFSSLGFDGGWIRRLLVRELAVVGLLAALVGLVSGELFAHHLSVRILGIGGWTPSLAAAGAALVGTVLLLTGTVVVASRRLERFDPATELRNG